MISASGFVLCAYNGIVDDFFCSFICARRWDAACTNQAETVLKTVAENLSAAQALFSYPLPLSRFGNSATLDDIKGAQHGD